MFYYSSSNNSFNGLKIMFDRFKIIVSPEIEHRNCSEALNIEFVTFLQYLVICELQGLKPDLSPGLKIKDILTSSKNNDLLYYFADVIGLKIDSDFFELDIVHIANILKYHEHSHLFTKCYPKEHNLYITVEYDRKLFKISNNYITTSLFFERIYSKFCRYILSLCKQSKHKSHKDIIFTSNKTTIKQTIVNNFYIIHKLLVDKSVTI